MSTRQHAFKVRVNSGILRGRQITFSGSGVRPTKSIVRKTVFNWLRPMIRGADCLDCFAGSGILAFDAISEGAKSVTCLDQDARVISDIQKNCEQLSVRNIRCFKHQYPMSISGVGRYDIVFCDPPFGDIGVTQCLEWLLDIECMRVGCLIYVEYPNGAPRVDWGPFKVLRSSRSAGVSFALLVYQNI